MSLAVSSEPDVIGSILINADEFVANFVRLKLGPHTRFAGGFSTLGVVRRGRFCGGVVYHNFVQLPYGNVIEASFAFDDPTWALPGTLRALCAYPFIKLGCVRVTALVAKSNRRSRTAVEKLGFTREGSHPKGMDGREAAISYGLLREDCMWIKPRSEWKTRKKMKE